MEVIRNLKIKILICKRIVKEFYFYEKEVEREVVKIVDMKDKGVDFYDFKQQVIIVCVCCVGVFFCFRDLLFDYFCGWLMQENVLGELRMMIFDCYKCFEVVLVDFKFILVNMIIDVESDLNFVRESLVVI